MTNAVKTVEIDPRFKDIKTLRTNLFPINSALELERVHVSLVISAGTIKLPSLQITDNYSAGVSIAKKFRPSMPTITKNFDETLRALARMVETKEASRKATEAMRIQLTQEGFIIPKKDWNPTLNLRINKIVFKHKVSGILVTCVHRTEKGGRHRLLFDSLYVSKARKTLHLKDLDKTQFTLVEKMLTDVYYTQCTLTPGANTTTCLSDVELRKQMETLDGENTYTPLFDKEDE